MLLRRKDFIFIWHGFFLALTMSMIDFNTVFPALITELTDSKIIFGLLYSIMLGIPLIFNLLFSLFLSKFDYKRRFLLTGIFLRGFSFLGMAVVTYVFSINRPGLVIISFFFWIFLFSLSGGFAGLAYTDIIGKLFEKKERGRIYAAKQLAGSLAALTGGFIVTRIFAHENFDFPLNYAVLLLIGFIGLLIASLGFWFIKEPISTGGPEERISLKVFLKRASGILKGDKTLSRFILVENLTSFSLMILPFYMVFAGENFPAGKAYIGRYLIYQVIGTIISNLFWGYIAGKKDARAVVRICLLLGAIIPILALILARLGEDFYGLIFFLVGFVISGRRIGFDPYLLDIAPGKERTVYLGIRGTLSWLIVLVPVAGGLLIELLGFEFTFILVFLVMSISFFLMGQRD